MSPTLLYSFPDDFNSHKLVVYVNSLCFDAFGEIYSNDQFFHESTQLSAMTSCPSHLQLIMNTHNNHPDYLQPSKGWQHFQYPHHTTSSQPQPLNPTTLSFLQSLFNIRILHTESLILELPLLISQQPKIRATAYFNHLHLLEYSFQNSQFFTNKHFKLPITFSKLLNLITLDQFMTLSHSPTRDPWLSRLLDFFRSCH